MADGTRSRNVLWVGIREALVDKAAESAIVDEALHFDAQFPDYALEEDEEGTIDEGE